MEREKQPAPSLLDGSEMDSRYRWAKTTERGSSTSSAGRGGRPPASLGDRYVPHWQKTDGSHAGASGAVSGLRPSEEVGLSFIESKTKPKPASVLVTRSAASTSASAGRSAHKEDRLRQRNEAIKLSLKALKQAQQLDLCFLMDCTGSMQPWVDQCHKSIADVVSLVQERFPMLQVRVAFVGYRDHTDPADQHFAVFPFGPLLDFQAFVCGVRASGGGDAPEDLLGGLDKALGLDWRNDSRVLFHIADCPCHGGRFHDYGPGQDTYYHGEPHRLQPEGLLARLAQQRIHYFFGKITPATDKMIAVFNQILASSSAMPITTLPFGNLHDFVPKVAESVSASICVESRAALHAGGRMLKSFTIDPSYPDWGAVAEERVKVFFFTLPGSIRAAVEDQLDLKTKTTVVKIAPRPFAQGACRLAYHLLETKYSEPRELVAKESKFTGPGMNSKLGYLQDLEAQTVATVFAKAFNDKFGLEKKVHFTKARLFSFFERSSARYIATEPRIHGVYVKYNNNAGFVASDNYRATLDAFSHWTWCASGEEMIIVDLQGVNYTLTDPAIHHRRHTDRYGVTNLGKAGIELFFQTHKCNPICTHLGLKRHARQPSTMRDLDDELTQLRHLSVG